MRYCHDCKTPLTVGKTIEVEHQIRKQKDTKVHKFNTKGYFCSEDCINETLFHHVKRFVGPVIYQRKESYYHLFSTGPQLSKNK